jgi:hypothetical protein
MKEANINLDDIDEALDFIEKFGDSTARQISKHFSFQGKGSVSAGQAIKNYAYNKVTAYNCRISGDIRGALMYEEVCDKIYSEDIEGKIVCW